MGEKRVIVEANLIATIHNRKDKAAKLLEGYYQNLVVIGELETILANMEANPAYVPTMHAIAEASGNITKKQEADAKAKVNAILKTNAWPENDMDSLELD